MGLDMYAYALSKQDEKEEIAQWRKFNALHGWMEDLYVARGGTESFNCVDLELFPADLYQLQQDIINKEMKPREGFFFGAQHISDYNVESTLTFIAKALFSIYLGEKVFYTSWW